MQLEGLPYFFKDQIYRKIIYHRLKLQGFVPEKESELYVSKIPRYANVFDLFEFFGKVGEIFQVKLMMQDGELSYFNRGYAFVTFFKKDLAQKAISSLNEVPFIIFNENYYLSITKSLDNCRIFLKGVPIEKSKQEIWEELKRLHPFANIVDVIVYASFSNAEFNRGYVFVEFPTHEDASRYRAKFERELFLFGNPIWVDWAVPLEYPDEQEKSTAKTLFVRNLQLSQDNYEYTNFVNQFICSDFVEKTYRFKSHAYIHLTTHEHAEQLMEKLKAYYKGTPVEVCFSQSPNKSADKTYRKMVLAERKRKTMREWLGTTNLFAYDNFTNTPSTSASVSASLSSASTSSSLDILPSANISEKVSPYEIDEEQILDELKKMVTSMINKLLDDD